MAYAAPIVKMKQAVVRVICTQSGRDCFSGTAFAAGPDNRFITNWHVVKESMWGWDVYLIDANKEYIACDIINYDKELDIAILKPQIKFYIEPAEIADLSEISVGEDVYAMGFPGIADIDDNIISGTEGITVTKGIVSKIIKSDNVYYVQTDAAVSGGNSGGPLYNSSGKVIGINSMRAIRDDNGNPVQGVSWAIRIDQAVQLLSGYNSINNVKHNEYNDEDMMVDMFDQYSKIIYVLSAWIMSIVIVVIILLYIRSSRNKKALNSSLKCEKGLYIGRNFKISTGLSIGRSASSSIKYTDDYQQVSRNHCKIIYESKSKQHLLVDTSSVGTYVNGKKMHKSIPYPLQNGDKISFLNDNEIYIFISSII